MVNAQFCFLNSLEANFRTWLLGYRDLAGEYALWPLGPTLLFSPTPLRNFRHLGMRDAPGLVHY